MRVIVTGATGFIGTRLCRRLVGGRHEVIALTRDASRSHDELHPKVRVASWAPGAPGWEALVDGAGAVVNLAGENIAQRWTARAKERIVASRVTAATRLREAVEKAKDRPKVLVNASAVGYYGPRGDENLAEDARPGEGFLADTCVKWEEEARRFEPLGLRVVRLRTGIVLSPEGGALAKMLLPAKLSPFLAPLGTGEQWMSWIHLDDLVELYVYALENPSVSGAVNGTAPAPVQMKDFTRALAAALPRFHAAPVGPRLRRRVLPFGLPPARLLRAALGEMSTVVLDGQRVLPRRAEALGFGFKFTDVGSALKDLVG